MRAVTRRKSHVRDRARPLPIASILSPTCDSLLPPILTLPPSALGKEALGRAQKVPSSQATRMAWDMPTLYTAMSH